MSGINSVRNLQILYFIKKKIRVLKRLKNRRISVLEPPFIHTTVKMYNLP